MGHFSQTGPIGVREGGAAGSGAIVEEAIARKSLHWQRVRTRRALQASPGAALGARVAAKPSYTRQVSPTASNPAAGHSLWRSISRQGLEALGTGSVPRHSHRIKDIPLQGFPPPSSVEIRAEPNGNQTKLAKKAKSNPRHRKSFSGKYQCTLHQQ